MNKLAPTSIWLLSMTVILVLAGFFLAFLLLDAPNAAAQEGAPNSHPRPGGRSDYHHHHHHYHSCRGGS